jgi:gamma-butyrobetaine dioxygenase
MFLIKHLRSFSHLQKVAQKRLVHDYLKVEIAGESLKFPHVWLRDNCQCEQCFHYSAKSRFIDWSEFDLNAKPKNVTLDANSVNVTWQDGHKSSYNLNWLKFRSFTPESQTNYYNTIYQPPKKTWNKDVFNEIFTKHDYNAILTTDQALYDLLYNFAVYGVVLIKNTPHTETALDAVLEKVAFPKKTHYGEKFFIQAVENTNNVAYLAKTLQMHTDLCYYEYCPGVSLLHCLVQTEGAGGENMLSNVHYVAEYMKEHHPEQYKLLVDTEVEWADVGSGDGKEFFKLYRAPVICLNKHGEITRVNFSIPQRGSYFPGPIETVAPWYEAHTLFLNLNHEHAAHFKTSEGDILIFDNRRMLHGRSNYEDTTSRTRKLNGAYLDWDEIYCRLRCLTVKLKDINGIN